MTMTSTGPSEPIDQVDGVARRIESWKLLWFPFADLLRGRRQVLESLPLASESDTRYYETLAIDDARACGVESRTITLACFSALQLYSLVRWRFERVDEGTMYRPTDATVAPPIGKGAQGEVDYPVRCPRVSANDFVVDSKGCAPGTKRNSWIPKIELSQITICIDGFRLSDTHDPVSCVRCRRTALLRLEGVTLTRRQMSVGILNPRPLVHLGTAEPSGMLGPCVQVGIAVTLQGEVSTCRSPCAVAPCALSPVVGIDTPFAVWGVCVSYGVLCCRTVLVPLSSVSQLRLTGPRRLSLFAFLGQLGCANTNLNLNLRECRWALVLENLVYSCRGVASCVDDRSMGVLAVSAYQGSVLSGAGETPHAMPPHIVTSTADDASNMDMHQETETGFIRISVKIRVFDARTKKVPTRTNQGKSRDNQGEIRRQCQVMRIAGTSRNMPR
ncbi:hypothetical protein V8E55_005147, partial [Tylopilus felleus]